jgi:hypothetical protein
MSGPSTPSLRATCLHACLSEIKTTAAFCSHLQICSSVSQMQASARASASGRNRSARAAARIAIFSRRAKPIGFRGTRDLALTTVASAPPRAHWIVLKRIRDAGRNAKGAAAEGRMRRPAAH